MRSPMSSASTTRSSPSLRGEFTDQMSAVQQLRKVTEPG